MAAVRRPVRGAGVADGHPDRLPDGHGSLLSIDGSLGLTRMLATQVGLDGAVFYRHARQTNRTPSSNISWTLDDYRLRFGLSVFVH